MSAAGTATCNIPLRLLRKGIGQDLYLGVIILLVAKPNVSMTKQIVQVNKPFLFHVSSAERTADGAPKVG